MLLIANKAHGYGGRRYKTGEVYEAREPTARALILAGISTMADDPSYRDIPKEFLETVEDVAKRQPKRLDPAKDAKPSISRRTGKPKRRYHRRDMVPVK